MVLLFLYIVRTDLQRVSTHVSPDRLYYLPLDGILQIPNPYSLGIRGTEADYFSTQQPLF